MTWNRSLCAVSCWTLASTFVLVISRAIYAFFLSPYRHVPGPRMCKMTQYWTIYHDLWLRRVEKIHEWHQKYGDVVLIAPGQVSFSDPVSTKEIYGASTGHSKSQYFDHFLAYGERSIFCTLNVREHRKLLKRTFAFYQPANIYQMAVLRPVRANVRKVLDKLTKSSQLNSSVDVLPCCNFFSFDNITRLLYGSELCARTIEDETCEEQEILAGWMDVEVWNNLLYNFPVLHKTIKTIVSFCTRDPDFLSTEDRLADWNMGRIDAARGRPPAPAVDSLLQWLHNTKISDIEMYPKSWVAAELLDNLHAAQSTVTLALTYVLWHLACLPQWQDRIRDELSTLPLQEDGLPASDDVLAAPVLDACVRESSRLKPLTSGRAERVAPVNRAYNGILLPAGTIVSTCTRSLHLRPDVFPQPEAYQPERWLTADVATLRMMESCYMPFGSGARLCLGKSFALVEIKLLIAGILMEFELHVDRGSGTTSQSMGQLGTQNALPQGRFCNLSLKRLEAAEAKQ